MSGIERVIYWDSCIYLAWLMDEQSHGKACMDAIGQVLAENFQRKNVIISSTITLIEVLAAKIGDEKEKLFRKSFRTQDHIAYDVDAAIALKARELREQFLAHTSGKTLATPDAIHVATAMIQRAKMLFTFDDGQKDKKHLGLLELDGSPIIAGLKICKPYTEQATLL